ncbi:MAG: hypothetical protein IPL40_05725 [Proteobacteria bacterium]|nr:hypothetical protein [Pseudomonadota bacterium]
MSGVERKASASPGSALPRRLRRMIDRHFAGGLGPSAERALRAELPDHPAARAYYERRQLLARLDPRALGGEERLARGLGLAVPRHRRRPLLLWGAVSAAAAASLVALLISQRLPLMTGGGGQRAAGDRAESFTARGVSAAPPALEIFAIVAGARSTPVRDGLAADAELAFAYRNPGQRAYLLLFAVDAQRRVYWYYPAWGDPQADPAAVPISRAAGLHELGEAIAHRYHGPTLAIHALFSDIRLTVRTVEAALARAPRGVDRALALPEVEDHVTLLRLRH